MWKGKHGIYKGKVVGLHDDFVFVKETIVTASGMKLLSGMIYRVEFEDIIARV